MPILQFAPFASTVSPAFWHKLTDLKIDVLRLSDAAIPITGAYSAGRTILDRETGREVVLGCGFSVGDRSFENIVKAEGGVRGEIKVEGTFKNFNTMEDFKNADKNVLFNEEADKLYAAFTSSPTPTSHLTRFLLITFADLKKYKYYYWFGFPAFVAKPAWEIDDEGWGRAAERGFSNEDLSTLDSLIAYRPFFLVKHGANRTLEVGGLEQYEQFYDGVAESERTIGFTEPSADPTNPGWPLRNLLAFLRLRYPQSTRSVRVLRWFGGAGAPTSLVGRVSINVDDESAPSITQARPSAVGWERNAQGKLGARLADLAPMMDPVRLASQAVDLNLKLMRWRILPALDLEKVSNTKCLLLGAGTLGCYVARGLMAWGVRHITFLDSARVSFSNPVRQPLFEFEDCLDGGKPKAECAAENLRKVFPGINATGHTLSIPMPGHPIPPASLAQTRADIAKLEALIKEHDVVFLLMDSRESRWLPAVVAARWGKLIINAALGFDTYLVMRHGVRASKVDVEGGEKRLGCYFCNDIVAPGDSLTDRTLDQMCTVTRPGLAPIAAATAVELMTSVLQHPKGIHAAPPSPTAGASDFYPTASYADQGGSVLGVVPHQIRGFLAQFRNLQLVGAGYERCSGCSESILQAYEQGGFDMLLRVFNEEGYLEKLSGLEKLVEEGEAALEAVEWDEDEGGSGEDF